MTIKTSAGYHDAILESRILLQSWAGSDEGYILEAEAHLIAVPLYSGQWTRNEPGVNNVIVHFYGAVRVRHSTAGINMAGSRNAVRVRLRRSLNNKTTRTKP